MDRTTAGFGDREDTDPWGRMSGNGLRLGMGGGLGTIEQKGGIEWSKP